MKKLKIKAKSMTNSEVIAEIVDTINEDREKPLRRADVKEVIGLYISIALDEIKSSGIFSIPGVVKIIRKFKPAREKRKGINPFTGEKCTFKAKPATYVAKARLLTKSKHAARGI